jgi:hypothetical protein
MVLPDRWFAPDSVQAITPIEYRQAVLSPAEAINKIEENLNQQVYVDSVQLLDIQGRPLYRVFMDDIGMRLVDAANGDLIWISPEIAEALARVNVGSYRIRFEGDGSNIYYVSLMSGAVSRSNSMTRIRAAITSLHTFEPIRLFTESGAVRKGILVILSLVGVIVSITGYVIFFLPYLRQKTLRKNSNKPKVKVV